MNDYRSIIYSSYRTSTYKNVNPGQLNAELMRGYEVEYGQWLPKDKSARILDAGCGSGFLIQYLKAKGFENASGVDTSEEQVAFCREAGLDVSQGNALDYLEQHGGFDVIFITDMVEHLSKDELLQMIEKVKQALNPGGWFIIRTINACSILGMHTRYIDLTHELSFSERSINQIFLAMGFSRIDINDTQVPFGLKPKRFVRWALFRCWRAVFKLILTLESGVDRPQYLGKYLLVRAQKPE